MITIKNEYQAFGEKHFFYLETKLYEILNEVMASCHCLIYANEILLGDPLDIKMFESTKW